ncbi:MAG: MMPL family transporter, partial [Candidatus Saccharimonadales bacterium]
MLNTWVKIVNKRPWAVLFISIFIILTAAIYGVGVFNKLSSGNDFLDPSKTSTKAYNLSRSEFPNSQSQLLVLFENHNGTILDPSFSSEVQSYLNHIASLPHVVKVNSYYSTGQARFVSANKTSTYVGIQLSGTDTVQKQVYTNLSNYIASHKNLATVKLGGAVAVNAQINEQITKDLKLAETISFPIVAILLLLIFGNVVAALIPLLLGGLSILCALSITRLLTEFTPMSAYVINVITLLGLGLAIDYSLFMVGRFREELRNTGSVDKALEETVKRAGRTIMFSGFTVVVSLLSLIVFPETFLHSMGLSGAAVVSCAVILSITIVPASLKLLGHRINALSLPGRNKSKVSKNDSVSGFWYRFSEYIMRKPVPILLVTLAFLLALGLPFLHARLSNPDISTLPNNFSSRQVNDALVKDYRNINTEPINIVSFESSGDPLSSANVIALNNYIKQIKQLPGVSGVDSVFTHIPPVKAQIGSASYDQLLNSKALSPVVSQYISGSYSQLNVYQSYSSQSSDAQKLVGKIRSITPPEGTTIYVGGQSAELVDLLKSLHDHIRIAGAIIFSATIILIFLLMGGLLVPLKAVVLGIISLSASFGILVWIFQSGHLTSYLPLSAYGSIDATSMVLIFAIAFGLSMDYEFFLLSRIKEEYEKTHDTTHSIAHGVQKTAGIITSAALLLISVIGLFTTSKISLIQQIGLGLAVAVAIDSTLVRMIMVPTTMRILGKANWWAPKPLKYI